MRFVFIIFWLACGVAAFAARAADNAATNAVAEPAMPLPAEASRLTDVYRVELGRIVAQHAEGLKALPAAYQAQLAALRKKLQASGDLDGYLAVEKEAKRFAAAISGAADPFEKIPEMPDVALVTTPEALRALQDQYVKSYQERLERRRKLIEDLTNAYIAQLETLTKDLTIHDRINDAIAVKHEIERLRKSVADGDCVRQALALAVTAAPPAAPTMTPATTPAIASAADWARWDFDRDGNFAWEGYLFRHPDLPDVLTLEFDARAGRGRVAGSGQVNGQVVDMRQRSWFGKALLWKVSDPARLNATFVLQNRELSPGQGAGPAAHLVLLGEKGPLGEGLDVMLMWPKITLTIARDPATGNVALGWTEGKVRKLVAPPDASAPRVLLGITVRHPGERCDTTIEMR